MAEELNDLKSGERSADQIRREIAAKRESLTDAVERLGDKIHETVDWRGYITRHPYAAVGVAAGAGLVVSRVLARRRHSSPAQKIIDALSDTADSVSKDLRKTIQRAVAQVFMKSAPPVMFKGALYGAASKVMASFLQNKMAGDGRSTAPSS
jgi:ElaB/YqjD/DUF883 family membrane-anchored ribosome-binding protein